MKIKRIVAVLATVAAFISVPAISDATSAYPAGCYSWGTASWGSGRVCYNSSGWYTETRDIKTDGYCVFAKYLSNGSWVTVPNSKACSSSTKTSSYFPRNVDVRLVREDGRYLTLDTSD